MKRPTSATGAFLGYVKIKIIENFLVQFVIYSYFKENAFTAAKMDTKMSTRYVKGLLFINTKNRMGYLFLQKGYKRG